MQDMPKKTYSTTLRKKRTEKKNEKEKKRAAVVIQFPFVEEMCKRGHGNAENRCFSQTFVNRSDVPSHLDLCFACNYIYFYVLGDHSSSFHQGLYDGLETGLSLCEI
jgi:hypothetical protein